MYVSVASIIFFERCREIGLPVVEFFCTRQLVLKFFSRKPITHAIDKKIQRTFAVRFDLDADAQQRFSQFIERFSSDTVNSDVTMGKELFQLIRCRLVTRETILRNCSHGRRFSVLAEEVYNLLLQR